MLEQRVHDLVNQAEQALTDLAELLAEPDALPFPAIREDLERLERAMTAKASVDTAFAWLADLHSAGRLVGSTRTVDYLVEKLGLSRPEAYSRLRQAEDLYAPPSEPEPDGPDADPAAEEEARREAERRREREHRAQEEARKKRASAEKRKMIERELAHLSKHAVPGRLELLSRALSEAGHRDVQDLRAWVREQVRRANAAATRPDGKKDPLAAWRKRGLRLSRPDVDGGVRIEGYLPGDMAAIIRAAVNPRTGTSSDEGDDKHTIEQRRADLLTEACRTFLTTKEPKARGVGSVLISMTVEDIEKMTLDSRFPTTGGDLLDPLALLRLGSAASDFVILHDDRGQPLDVRRARRTANFHQRIALLAAELVCTRPGCDHPGDECDVHHLVAWARGGGHGPLQPHPAVPRPPRAQPG